MANLAPPIIRDGFVYHGDFYADVGNLNRHSRASEADLTALLRPNATASVPPKDPVGHWYTAQLKHYGLPATKDKNAAKVRLLAALNAGTLQVPPDVKKLEAQLKKEYNAANRKAKAELKGQSTPATVERPALKRKRDDGEGPAQAAATPKKTKTPAKEDKVASKKDPRVVKGDKPLTTKPKASAKEDRATPKKAITTVKQAATASTKAKAPVKEDRPVTKKAKASASEEKAAPKKQVKKQPASAGTATPGKKTATAVKATPETKAGGPAKNLVHADQKGRVKRGHEVVYTDAYDPWGQDDVDPDTLSDRECVALVQQDGLYHVELPSIQAAWPNLNVTATNPLKILLGRDGTKMWGSYDFGYFSGLILLDSAPKRAVQNIRFVWRGTDTSVPGKVQYHTGLGEMYFHEWSLISGTFFNLHGFRCNFNGKHPSWHGPFCDREAASFKAEWEEYGRANNWTGRPPIRNAPPGEKLRNFARSERLSALKTAESRVISVDHPSGPGSAKNGTLTKKNDPAINKSATKASAKGEPEGTPTNSSLRKTSVIKSEDDFYSNSPSALSSVLSQVAGDIGQVTGIYNIRCPTIEDNWPYPSEKGLRLLLCHDARNSRVWGSFAWGPFFGMIQMNPGPSEYSSQAITLGWRARDEENGSVRFGRGCNGAMEFSEPGVVEGRLFNLFGDVMEFWGNRRPGPKNCGHAPAQFEQEWNSFPSDVYGSRQDEGEESLYDENGNLNPKGRYSELMEKTLRG